MRDVIAIDNTDNIDPLLYYFKKGLTHIGVVTKVVNDESK
jgi:hypothetical protein